MTTRAPISEGNQQSIPLGMTLDPHSPDDALLSGPVRIVGQCPNSMMMAYSLPPFGPFFMPGVYTWNAAMLRLPMRP